MQKTPRRALPRVRIVRAVVQELERFDAGTIDQVAGRAQKLAQLLKP